jgi:Amt family ammonium transporter
MLVVDDNSTNCEILSSQLSNWGIEASVCQESSNVVERMLVAHRLNRSFDLVILDYFMPEMNGCDVAMEIGKHPELAGIPLILLSSSHEMLSAEQLDAHGINVALTKPARQSRLLDSIMNVLYRRAEVSQSSSSDRSTPEVQNAVAANVVKATPEPVNTALQPALAPKVESYEADVLVVEDNEVNRLVVEQMLESVGYTCRSVTDGEKACSEVCQSRYRMILMDGHMPVMDGRTATREIRRLESIGATLCQNIPVVALTANVVQGAQQEFLDSGMNDYLGKPVTLEKLQAMVEKHIGKPQPRVAGPQAPLTPTRTEAIATVDSFNEPSGSIQTAAAASAPVSPKVTAQPATAALTNDGAADGRLVNCDLLVEQCGGNQQFTHQILALMRDSLPQQLSSLDDATCSYDFVKVASIAHQIKGAAGDSCLTAVYQSASDLEQHALQGRTDSTVATLGALRARVDDTIGVINQLLSEQ